MRASMVESKAYLYASNNRGVYPESAAVFTQGEYSTSSSSSGAPFKVLNTLPEVESGVGYQRCGKSAQVIYRGDNNTYIAIGLGQAPSGIVTKFC